MKHKGSTRRFSERKQQAINRQSLREKLNNLEQIAVLNKRLGIGIGAVKERQRLTKVKEEVEKIETKTIQKVEKKEKKFKVKKHQDPIKEKKKFRRQQKEEK